MGSEGRRTGGRVWKNLKEKLGFKGMIGCCGTNWGSETTSTLRSMTVGEIPVSVENSPNLVCRFSEFPVVASGMNLGTALAAERNIRAVGSGGGSVLTTSTPSTPLRNSLMKLIQETDGVDCEKEKERKSNVGGNDTVCCVCMERKLGAAFIPCGHTFCRVCSREILLNRGSCAICNRPIKEILDIF